MEPKPLDKASIMAELKTRWLGKTLTILDECTSTNDEVDKMGEGAAPEGTVVIAETQQSGRGRFRRRWYSPRGGVWLSVLIRPRASLPFADSLPLIGALAVGKVLVQKWGVKAGVRWPNDVVAGGRKIAGILAESKSRGNNFDYVTLGLGINANIDVSEIEPIRGISTSLQALVGAPVNRERLIAAILSELESMFESVEATGEIAVMQTLRDLDWSRGKHVRVRTADREFEGLFDDYENLDKVRIKTSNGPEHVRTGTLVSVDYESD